MELLKNLQKYTYLHDALVSNLLGVLAQEIPSEVVQQVPGLGLGTSKQ